MEWFNELSTGWKMLTVNIGLLAIPFLLPNRIVVGAGKAVGKFLSIFLRQRIGKAEGEKVEGYLTGTIQAFVVDGIIAGMTEDNNE